ncbi:MAG: XRE family transcriptional regulator [Bacteroidetes bacterium]|nr:MAG: XRE family transcriptional regulator [Bacteroidota bacterium]
MNEDGLFLKSIGDNIRKLRNERNISQQELADLANIAKSTVQRIEAGKLNPTILVLNRISKVLEVGIMELIHQ